MTHRQTTFLSICLMSVILVACGNKGDLFLPADAQLAEELEAVTGDLMNDRSSDLPELDDDDDDKPKRK